MQRESAIFSDFEIGVLMDLIGSIGVCVGVYVSSFCVALNLQIERQQTRLINNSGRY